MPRRPRAASGNHIYHVLNRSVGRSTIFDGDADYLAYIKVLNEARDRVACRLLAFCLMPNHWHLILWPRGDEDLSEFMRWLTGTHTQRWHACYDTAGTGPLYQGRFKSFPVQADSHFYSVCRYVERNALRANLVRKAENWRWGSLWQCVNAPGEIVLDKWPIDKPKRWVECVNQPQSEAEVASIQNSIRRGAPYGNQDWTQRTARRLQLESTLRARGRPRKAN